MNRQDVEARTEDLFRGGLHCAEAVLQAVLEGQGLDTAECSPRAATAEALRQRFATEYGCTRCFAVLEKLGAQERMDKCVRLAGRTAGMVHEVLNGDSASRPVQACGCGELHAPPATFATPAPSGCGCGCK